MKRYLRETTIPALERGATRAGRSLDGFEINVPGFVIARDTEQEIGASVALVRQQIGFCGSAPAYRPVLDTHGRGELQDELNPLTKREWDQLAGVIDDQILHTSAVIPERWAPVLESLRATVAAA